LELSSKKQLRGFERLKLDTERKVQFKTGVSYWWESEIDETGGKYRDGTTVKERARKSAGRVRRYATIK